jgi:hypothetical protein
MYSAHAFELPNCPVCTESVSLECAVTDEFGQAIHAKCYLWNLGVTQPITMQRKPSRASRVVVRVLVSEE